MSITTNSRSARGAPTPTACAPTGPDSLSGQAPADIHRPRAAEGQDSPQAIRGSAPAPLAPAGTIDTVNGQSTRDTQGSLAAEGQNSPQVKAHSIPMLAAPAGNKTAPPAKPPSAPMAFALEGRKTSHGHIRRDTQGTTAVAVDVPGGHHADGTHPEVAAGDSGPGQPAANDLAAPKEVSPLADPLLSLAADVLDDLEKVRIANENRLRQLTRSEEDSDGETRGFGLDESHPDVARLAALVGMLGEAEHRAELNLGRIVRRHPLGPWVKVTAGIGEKQGARLLAAIGDPYIRPEITREDGTTEPSRPRRVSELWAYCGYHVIKTPVSGHRMGDTHSRTAADGLGIPADYKLGDSQSKTVGGEQNGHPGYRAGDTQTTFAGVAAKRARGQHANWSATAKMRGYLVAVSCMKCMDSPYRKVYDDTRAKYAQAVHEMPCIRCGPSGKPAQPGSPLSDGHKHARALRAVAKEVLRDLWREAKRIHEAGAA